jgi:hypothetical protein
MTVCPTIVQVIPHASGATAGVSAGAIRAANIPIAIVGKMRREKNFNAALPADRRMIMKGLANRSAILCFRSSRKADAQCFEQPTRTFASALGVSQ